MKNKFNIPEKELNKIQERDRQCVYCHKKLLYPYSKNNPKNSATIEHLNFNGPFYWNEGLELKDIVMCCGSCNSSRGIKKLEDWFKTKYCIEKEINENTVAEPVKKYIKNKKNY